MNRLENSAPTVKAVAICGLIFLTSIEPINAIELRGSYQLNTAYNSNGNYVQKIESIVALEVEQSFDSGLRVFGLTRFSYDNKDLIEPGQADQSTVSPINRRKFFGDKGEVTLRELFVDGYLGDTFFRLGKQQIVWGQADGLQVLDVVNPQHFREFIYQDLEYRRLPLWTANIEIPLGEWTSQLLWIPDQSYHQTPETGALFQIRSAYLAPQFPANTSITVEEIDKPEQWVKDSDFGLKFSAFLSGWDVSVNYFYHHLDSPQFKQTLSDFGITATPTYQRSHLMGGSLSNAFGNITLRGEAAYTTDKFFYLRKPNLQLISTTEGGIISNEFSMVIGLDYNGLSDTLISGQVFSNVIAESDNLLFRDKVETQLSLLIRREFFNTTLRTEVLAIHSLNNRDGSVQASLAYEWRSQVQLSMGIDVAYGDQSGLFGQFDRNDAVHLGLEVSF